MASFDLSVNKTGTPNPAGIGQPIIYTIVARNNGPDTATGVTLTDTIPAGVCLKDITVQQGSYCYENGVITWNAGVLLEGETATMTVTVIPQNEGTIGNTANIYHNNEDDEETEPENNQSTAEITVNPAVNLVILKESCPTETIIGDSITYFITVLNNGPSTANNVIVTDNIPAGVTIDSVTSDQGICQILGNIISCSLASLDINERWDIKVKATPSIAGTIENTVEVYSDEPNLNPENNIDKTTTIINPSADLSVTKGVSQQEVVVGDILTYMISVANNGPSGATNVILDDILPEDVDVDSITPSQGNCNQIGNIITCKLGDLGIGDTATVEIKVKPSEQGIIVNSVNVSASEADPNESNNATSICAYVKKALGTDISVEKFHTQEPAIICTPVLYTIKVTNNGPTSATGIVLYDQVPSSLKILSLTSSQGRCCICDNEGCHNPTDYCHCGHNDDCCEHHNHCFNNKRNDCQSDHCYGNSEIICQIGTLAIGESATVKICARPKIIGTITNTAVVTANEEDLNPSNNEAIDTLTVVTIQEKIELLINYINQLITLGLVEEENGNLLIEYLKDAKRDLYYHNTKEAQRKLESLIKKIQMYIKKENIPEEQGHYLKKEVLFIKRNIEYSYDCAPCREHENGDCIGDDLHE